MMSGKFGAQKQAAQRATEDAGEHNQAHGHGIHDSLQTLRAAGVAARDPATSRSDAQNDDRTAVGCPRVGCWGRLLLARHTCQGTREQHCPGPPAPIIMLPLVMAWA